MAKQIIDGGHCIRNGSGDFACEACWLKEFGRFTYPDTICSKCGAEAEWSEEATRQAQGYAERRLQKEAKHGKL